MITRAVCRVLVGREGELSTLEDALLSAARGEGTVVLVAGDAGVGKSRLCSEVGQRAEKIGAAVMEGSCSEADLALPYLPFLEAIGNHLADTDVATLRRELGVHGQELARIFPQLTMEGSAGPGTELPDARLRFFEAVLAILRIAAAERGLLLIVEDLHWADSSTRELLDYLTRRLRSTRVLVLATYRRDEMHRKHPLLPTLQGWQRSRLAHLVELEPLPPDEVARMVSSIFDDTNVGNEFRDFMHQRSEGNPFVVEEMLKAAIDRGDIFRDDSDWQRKPIAELRIPETVRDTILLRVERLDREQAEILRCASVLGRSFDYQTLIALSDQQRSAVETALQTAVQQQLLEEEPGTGGRYRFRHALTQEAIYEDLSAPTRERLHSAAADALSAGPVPRNAEVAYHLRAANRWSVAVGATLLAATEAEESYGFAEAAVLYSLLLPAIPAGIERGRLLCRLGEAYWRAASPGQAVEPLEEGVRILDALGETAEAARHRLALGRCHWERGELAPALAAYELARGVLETVGPSRELAVAYIRLSGLRCFSFDGRGGQDLAERAIEIAQAVGADDMRIWALTFVGMGLVYQGDGAAGIEALERSAREAEDRGLIEIAGNALHNLTVASLEDMQVDRLAKVIPRLRAIPLESWGVLSSIFAEVVLTHQTGAIVRSLEHSRDLHARALRLDNGFFVQLAGQAIAICLTELDLIEEARPWARFPDLETNAQDIVNVCARWIRFHLAAGELPAAVEGAQVLLDHLEQAWGNDEGAEAAAEALVAVGRVDDAARLQPILESAPSRLARCASRVLHARIALARGDPAPARTGLVDSIAAYDRAGLLLSACRARLLLARIDRHLDDPHSAEKELRGVAAVARENGLVLLERQVRDELHQLGIVADEPSSPTKVAETPPVEVGERLVTVMFADVRGYTAMTAGTPPAEMVDRISAYQRWAAQEVERHLGVVDKFAGDAVMATFNVSGTQVDHAEHALQAAFALRDKAALLGLPVGIGIATGAAVVGRLKDGANLSVVGEATNLAARLQVHAKPREVLLSQETHRRLRNDLQAEPEPLALKGFEQPVTVFRVPDPRTAVSEPT